VETGEVANEAGRWRTLTRKRFSRPHPDYQTMLPHLGCQGRLHYEAYKNCSPEAKAEIFDVYFGKVFRTNYQGHPVSWGNVMGVEASDQAVDWLFRLQDDLGIQVSLTMNQMNIPWEMYYSEHRKVLGDFLKWLAGFYERGLRSCTIGNAHLMASGVLQREFPEMIWKNTVNQHLTSAQMVVDCLELGYTFIQLDRSLNRNIDELRQIKRAVDAYRRKYPGKPVNTCLLVEEACLPDCPFKREHDDIQIRCHPAEGGYVYWEEMGRATCGTWRAHPQYGALPRTGTACVWTLRETFEEYADLVDVFKSSGRLGLTHPPDAVVDQGSIVALVWGVNQAFLEAGKASLTERDRMRQVGAGLDRTAVFVDSFADILEQNLAPINAWMSLLCDLTRFHPPLNVDRFPELVKGHFYSSRAFLDLEQTLKNCRNQCWSCHRCEQVYGVLPVDSLVRLTRPGGN
jgi:hypothetical protein